MTKLFSKIQQGKFEERDLDEVDQKNWPELAFMLVRFDGMTDILQKLMDKGLDLGKIRDSKGFSLLHIAAYAGAVENVKFCVEKAGIDVDCTKGGGEYEKRAIHVAAQSGNEDNAIEIVRFLHLKGAKIDALFYKEGKISVVLDLVRKKKRLRQILVDLCPDLIGLSEALNAVATSQEVKISLKRPKDIAFGDEFFLGLGQEGVVDLDSIDLRTRELSPEQIISIVKSFNYNFRQSQKGINTKYIEASRNIRCADIFEKFLTLIAIEKRALLRDLIVDAVLNNDFTAFYRVGNFQCFYFNLGDVRIGGQSLLRYCASCKDINSNIVSSILDDYRGQNSIDDDELIEVLGDAIKAQNSNFIIGALKSKRIEKVRNLKERKLPLKYVLSCLKNDSFDENIFNLILGLDGVNINDLDEVGGHILTATFYEVLKFLQDPRQQNRKPIIESLRKITANMLRLSADPCIDEKNRDKIVGFAIQIAEFDERLLVLILANLDRKSAKAAAKSFTDKTNNPKNKQAIKKLVSSIIDSLEFNNDESQYLKNMQVVAASCGNKQMFEKIRKKDPELLLRRNRFIQGRDMNNENLLHLAIIDRNWRIVETLIEAGLDINQTFKFGVGDFDGFELLLAFMNDEAREAVGAILRCKLKNTSQEKRKEIIARVFLRAADRSYIKVLEGIFEDYRSEIDLNAAIEVDGEKSCFLSEIIKKVESSAISMLDDPSYINLLPYDEVFNFLIKNGASIENPNVDHNCQPFVIAESPEYKTSMISSPLLCNGIDPRDYYNDETIEKASDAAKAFYYGYEIFLTTENLGTIEDISDLVNNRITIEETVKENARKGPSDIDACKPGSTWTALCMAISIERDIEFVEGLLKLGACVNGKEDGELPLIVAIDYLYVGAVEKLLEFGADINKIDVGTGRSALGYLLYEKGQYQSEKEKDVKLSLLKVLVDKGANIEEIKSDKDYEKLDRSFKSAIERFEKDRLKGSENDEIVKRIRGLTGTTLIREKNRTKGENSDTLNHSTLSHRALRIITGGVFADFTANINGVNDPYSTTDDWFKQEEDQTRNHEKEENAIDRTETKIADLIIDEAIEKIAKEQEDLDQKITDLQSRIRGFLARQKFADLKRADLEEKEKAAKALQEAAVEIDGFAGEIDEGLVFTNDGLDDDLVTVEKGAADFIRNDDSSVEFEEVAQGVRFNKKIGFDAHKEVFFSDADKKESDVRQIVDEIIGDSVNFSESKKERQKFQEIAKEAAAKGSRMQDLLQIKAYNEELEAVAKNPESLASAVTSGNLKYFADLLAKMRQNGADLIEAFSFIDFTALRQDVGKKDFLNILDYHIYLLILQNIESEDTAQALKNVTELADMCQDLNFGIDPKRRKNKVPNRGVIDGLYESLHQEVQGKDRSKAKTILAKIIHASNSIFSQYDREKLAKIVRNCDKDNEIAVEINSILRKTPSQEQFQRPMATPTLLICAIEYQNLELVKFFVERGANVDFSTYRNKTPLDVAIECNCDEEEIGMGSKIGSEIETFLEEKGARRYVDILDEREEKLSQEESELRAQKINNNRDREIIKKDKSSIAEQDKALDSKRTKYNRDKRDFEKQKKDFEQQKKDFEQQLEKFNREKKKFEESYKKMLELQQEIIEKSSQRKSEEHPGQGHGQGPKKLHYNQGVQYQQPQYHVYPPGFNPNSYRGEQPPGYYEGQVCVTAPGYGGQPKPLPQGPRVSIHDRTINYKTP